MQTMRLSYSNIFYQICGEMSFIQCVFCLQLSSRLFSVYSVLSATQYPI